MFKKLTLTQLKIFKNLNWLFAAYIYRFIFGFFVLAFVTRYLGPEQYGVYSYALSAFSFVNIFIAILNQEVLKKKFLDKENYVGPLLKTSMATMFLLTALLFITCLGLLWLTDVETGLKRILISIFSVSLFFRPFDILACYMSSQMRNDLTSKADIWKVSIFNGLRLVLVLSKSNLIAFAFSWTLQMILSAFMFCRYYTKAFSLTFLKSKLDFKLMGPVLKASFPLFFAATASVLLTNIDKVMLGKLLDDESVGLYSVVVKLSETWGFLAGILAQAIFPNLVTEYKENQENFFIKIHKSFCLLTYAALGIVCFVGLFATPLIKILFSDLYLEAVPVLKIHIFYVLFIFWMYLNNQFEVIVGATNITLIKTLLASVLNIGLNYLFIQKFGVIGATYATIISYIFASFLLNLIFTRTRALFFLQLKSLFFWKHRWVYKSSSS